MSPDGSVYYYANYNIGGGAKRNGLRWACCAGTRPQAIADYYDLVYFKDPESIYVNLFAPSTARWSCSGNAVILTQKTRFPERDGVEIVVSATKPSMFAIKVRVPGWLAGPMTAKVNGKPTKVRKDKLNWAVFRRTWEDGDRLSIELPMGFWSARFPDSSDEQFPAAVLRGPVVLVFRSEDENPSRLADLDKLATALIPSPGESLTYHLAADPSVLVRPFYAVKAGERYEVIATTFYGMPFLRYRVGDLIQIVSLTDEETGINIPQMVFESRADDIIDIAGFARLDEKTVWQAINNIGIRYEDWCIRKEYREGQPVLHLYIELKDSVSPKRLQRLLHESLKAIDPNYNDLDRMLQVRPLRATLLSRGTFECYLQEKRAAGFDLAHLKPPHTSASDTMISDLVRLSEKCQSKGEEL